MNKPIYKAQARPYGNEDINDLIEKGGEGSGKKKDIKLISQTCFTIIE